MFLGSLFFCSILLESTLLPFFPIPGMAPNITMILVICYALYYEEKNGAVIGFTAGFFKDMVVGRVVGISALTFMIIGFLVGYYNRKVFVENATTPFVLTVASTILHESMTILAVFLMGYPIQIAMTLNRVYIYQTIYNALVAVPIYFIVNQLLYSHFLRKSY